jgi:hypothetical protein
MNILCVYYSIIGNNSKFMYFIRLIVKDTSSIAYCCFIPDYGQMELAKDVLRK